MQEQNFEGEQPDYSTAARNQMNRVTAWELAKEFHIGRNTVANIAKELSIGFKYENYSERTRAFVYDREVSQIRQVLEERYHNHMG